jgi:hypothetical protein
LDNYRSLQFDSVIKQHELRTDTCAGQGLPPCRILGLVTGVPPESISNHQTTGEGTPRNDGWRGPG